MSSIVAILRRAGVFEDTPLLLLCAARPLPRSHPQTDEWHCPCRQLASAAPPCDAPVEHSTLEGVALPLDAAMPDYEQGATRAPDSFTPVQCLNTLRATRAFAAATPSLRWAGGDVCSRTGVPCWISALGPASIGIAAAGSLPGMPDDVACSNAVIAAGSSWSPGAMSSSTLPCRWCLLQYVAVVYLCRARVGGARLASWSWMGSAAAWAMQATAVNRTLPNVSMLQLPSGKLHCRYPASWPQVRPVAPIASRGSSLCGCAPQPGMDAQTVHFGVDAESRCSDCATAHACTATTTPTTATTTTSPTACLPPRRMCCCGYALTAGGWCMRQGRRRDLRVGTLLEGGEVCCGLHPFSALLSFGCFLSRSGGEAASVLCLAPLFALLCLRWSCYASALCACHAHIGARAGGSGAVQAASPHEGDGRAQRQERKHGPVAKGCLNGSFGRGDTADT